jgi:hypothetical protein
MEILFEIIGMLLEAIFTIFFEGVSAEPANLGRDLSAIRKGKR